MIGELRARELVRIAQEALVNIRKHSGASQVVVRFAASATNWTLGIDDDGRGFDPAGRHTLDDLDRTRRGPALIKERVRGIRGRIPSQALRRRNIPAHCTQAALS